MKNLYSFLVGLHIFVGLGALFGGLACIINPLNPFGVQVEVLKNSPFSDFLIPGIILFAIIGLGNIIAALTVFLRTKLHGYISSVFSWALVFWITTQCIMLGLIAAPHAIYFIIGLIEVYFSAAILFEQRQFPTNLILGAFKKISKKG